MTGNVWMVHTCSACCQYCAAGIVHSLVHLLLLRSELTVGWKRAGDVRGITVILSPQVKQAAIKLYNRHIHEVVKQILCNILIILRSNFVTKLMTPKLIMIFLLLKTTNYHSILTVHVFMD